MINWIMLTEDIYSRDIFLKGKLCPTFTIILRIYLNGAFFEKTNKSMKNDSCTAFTWIKHMF